jgi:hypothetical protein
MNEAKAAGKRLLADFKPTSRNRMMLVAFRFANFVEVEKHDEYVLLQNDLTQIQQFPEYINVKIINQINFNNGTEHQDQELHTIEPDRF